MSQPQVAVVDAFRTTYGYGDACAALGAGVIQIQSTPRLPPTVTPVDPSKFTRYLVNDGDLDRLTDTLAALGTQVVMAARETGVELADALSERLGLASNGTALSSARRNKYVQIERLRTQGVPVMRQIRTADEAELRAWHEALGGMAVVKPLRSAGGYGVTFCSTPDESAAALSSLLRSLTFHNERNTHVVAQEYLVGAEYIVNTVSCEGVHHITDVWSTDRITANGVPDLVVAQVLLRSDDPSVGELAPYVHQVLDALGIRYGAAHLEIKLTPAGPRLVEAAARPSGLPYFVEEAIGEGQFEWSADAYLRPERFMARAGSPYRRQTAFAWAALASPVSGRLVRYRALDEVERLESFRDMSLLVEPGDRIVPTTYDFEYPATLTLSHPVEAVLRRDLNTLRFLDGAGMYEVEEEPEP